MQFNLEDHITALQGMERIPVLLALEDKVIVLPDAADSHSKGGIIIPDTAKEEQKQGLVLAVGTRTLSGEPMNINVGDRVVFTKYAGTELNYGERTLKCIRHADISLVCEAIKGTVVLSPVVANEEHHAYSEEEYSEEAQSEEAQSEEAQSVFSARLTKLRVMGMVKMGNIYDFKDVGKSYAIPEEAVFCIPDEAFLNFVEKAEKLLQV